MRFLWQTALTLAILPACSQRGDNAPASGAVGTAELRRFASTVAAIGIVTPQIGAEVRVGSRISGRLSHLRANIGDVVKRGQVIAELESAEHNALVAQRRAELKAAEAGLAAVSRIGPQDSARVTAQIMGLEASASLAKEEHDRYEKLARTQTVTAAEVATMRERLQVAQAELAVARKSLDIIRATGAQKVLSGAAEVQRASAALEGALVDLAFTVIRSPIDGVVASVFTQEGETVAAGLNAPTFVTIIDLNRLQVNTYVDEVDIGKVVPKQRATFTVDAFPARDFPGTVSAVYPSATIQDNVVKYVVAVTIDGEYSGFLRPEMTASVRIQLEEREVLAIPARAVRRSEGRSLVIVLVDGQPAERAARLGWRDGQWVEVVEGLKAGECILVDPAAK